MEIIAIHEPSSLMTPEMMAATIEIAKKLVAKPEAFVPGGKMLATYGGRTKMVVICIWEVPNLEVLLPAFEQMRMLGWNSEIIPVEKMEVHLEKYAKAMEAMAKR